MDAASTDDCPDSFAKSSTCLASSALGGASVHDDETKGLFGDVVGGPDAWGGDEGEVFLAVLSKPLGHVDDFRVMLLDIPLNGAQRGRERGRSIVSESRHSKVVALCLQIGNASDSLWV